MKLFILTTISAVDAFTLGGLGTIANKARYAKPISSTTGKKVCSDRRLVLVYEMVLKFDVNVSDGSRYSRFEMHNEMNTSLPKMSIRFGTNYGSCKKHS